MLDRHGATFSRIMCLKNTPCALLFPAALWPPAELGSCQEMAASSRRSHSTQFLAAWCLSTPSERRDKCETWGQTFQAKKMWDQHFTCSLNGTGGTVGSRKYMSSHKSAFIHRARPSTSLAKQPAVDKTAREKGEVKCACKAILMSSCCPKQDLAQKLQQ